MSLYPPFLLSQLFCLKDQAHCCFFFVKKMCKKEWFIYKQYFTQFLNCILYRAGIQEKICQHVLCYCWGVTCVNYNFFCQKKLCLFTFLRINLKTLFMINNPAIIDFFTTTFFNLKNRPIAIERKKENIGWEKEIN